MKQQDDTPFFVGYLPTPEKLKKFYWPVVILLLAFSAYLGYAVAAYQKSPVPATWNTAETVTMEGILTLHPYPAINRVHPDQEGQVESVLLVAQGKHGADRYAAELDGKTVSVTGNVIQRGGWTMLEIANSESFSENTSIDASTISAQLTPQTLGDIELSGRIADSKCFLGVMKPGSGRVHRACAEVCIGGGIPPMLIASQDNVKMGYVLAEADGTSASQSLASLVAVDVQIKGELIQRGDLQIIRIHPQGVKRI